MFVVSFVASEQTFILRLGSFVTDKMLLFALFFSTLAFFYPGRHSKEWI